MSSASPVREVQKSASARVVELLMAFGAAALPPEMVALDGDIVTVTAPDGGSGTITATPETDELGPYWDVRQYDHDPGDEVVMSATLFTYGAVVDLVTAALFSRSGGHGDAEPPSAVGSADSGPAR